MILEMSFQQCRPCPAETGKVGHAHLLQHFGFLSALLPLSLLHVPMFVSLMTNCPVLMEFHTGPKCGMCQLPSCHGFPLWGKAHRMLIEKLIHHHWFPENPRNS